MARSSLLLACALLSFVAVAGDASACPSSVHHARVVPSARGRGGNGGNGAVSADGADGYNLARVNAYRSAAGLAPVMLDPSLTSFARAGSLQLMRDHVPHAHFKSAGDAMWHQGFTGGAAENQGSNTGWPRAAADPTQNEQRQIDQILASMMGEGPNGGHYGNMMNPKAKRIGIGLVEDGDGKLYLTNDFSQ